MLTEDWKKSTRSGGNSDMCVKVRRNAQGVIEVGDTKNPGGPTLSYTPGEWEAFLAGAKDGEFDL